MADKSVMVLVDAQDSAALDSVAAEVGRNGLKIEQVLRGMRTIVGTVSDELTLDRVRGVRGVRSIRAEGEVTLPPMDPSIPQ